MTKNTNTATNATNESTMKAKMGAAIAKKASREAKPATKAPAAPAPEAPKTPEAPAAPVAAKKSEPFGGKKAEPFKTLGERDIYGFGQDTETSWLLKKLEEGKLSKAALLEAFLAKFVPDANTAEQKRKKTSFSVFFSDVRKPFGTYHASRSLEIVADEAGILSITPESAARAKKAIASDILSKLRGFTPKKHHDKINAVLTAFKLPTLPAIEK